MVDFWRRVAYLIDNIVVRLPANGEMKAVNDNYVCFLLRIVSQHVSTFLKRLYQAM